MDLHVQYLRHPSLHRWRHDMKTSRDHPIYWNWPACGIDPLGCPSESFLCNDPLGERRFPGPTVMCFAWEVQDLVVEVQTWEIPKGWCIAEYTERKMNGMYWNDLKCTVIIEMWDNVKEITGDSQISHRDPTTWLLVGRISRKDPRTWTMEDERWLLRLQNKLKTLYSVRWVSSHTLSIFESCFLYFVVMFDSFQRMPCDVLHFLDVSMSKFSREAKGQSLYRHCLCTRCWSNSRSMEGEGTLSISAALAQRTVWWLCHSFVLSCPCWPHHLHRFHSFGCSMFWVVDFAGWRSWVPANILRPCSQSLPSNGPLSHKIGCKKLHRQSNHRITWDSKFPPSYNMKFPEEIKTDQVEEIKTDQVDEFARTWFNVTAPRMSSLRNYWRPWTLAFTLTTAD